MSEIRPPQPALEPETEHFWRSCRAGRLELVRCRDCGWYVHPPRPVCPRCQARDVGWETVSGRGRVYSFTVNAQPWMPGVDRRRRRSSATPSPSGGDPAPRMGRIGRPEPFR